MAKPNRLTLQEAQKVDTSEEASTAGVVALLLCLAGLGAITLGGWIPFSWSAPFAPLILALLAKLTLWGLGGLGILGGIVSLFTGVPAALKGTGGSLLDAEIVDRCRSLGEAVPAEIVEPLERALNAFLGIRRLSAESAWKGSGVAVEAYVRQARAHLLELLGRSRVVAQVGGILQRVGSGGKVPEHYRDTAATYRRYCETVRAAAELMERTEAGMSQTVLALAARRRSNPAIEESLREMQGHLRALSEALETLSRISDEEVPAVPATPETQEATQRLRGGA